VAELQARCALPGWITPGVCPEWLARSITAAGYRSAAAESLTRRESRMGTPCSSNWVDPLGMALVGAVASGLQALLPD